MHVIHMCSSYILYSRMNEVMTLKMAKMARRCGNSVIIEELQLMLDNPAPAVTSRLALLLRVWTIRVLDLTKCQIDGPSLICLLCLNSSFSIRLVKCYPVLALKCLLSLKTYVYYTSFFVIHLLCFSCCVCYEL